MIRPSIAEIQAFAARASADIASCWLALPRIQKWGLTLDHPRAAKLARGEANRSVRAQWAESVTMPPRDGRAATVDSDTAVGGAAAVRLDESLMAERFREQPAKAKKWAMGLIHIDESAPATPLDKLIEDEEAAARVAAGRPADPDEARDLEREAQKKQAIALRAAVKPRDRVVLDLYVAQGLKIKQVAETVGKTDKAIYAAVVRMRAPLRAARERMDWVREHCTIAGTGDAPVILEKPQQLGWDFGGAE